MHSLIRAAYHLGTLARKGMVHAARRRHRQSVAVFATALITLSAVTSLGAADRHPLVVVSTVQTDTVIKQVPLTGTITSARVARISPAVSGQVEAVNVEVGDRVESGAALIELDREIEQLTLAALQASTQQARFELADAKRRPARRSVRVPSNRTA